MMAVTAVERGGKARARKGTTHSGHVIANALYAWLDREAVLVTDELPAYRWIGRKFRAHLRINHSKGEWVRRDPLATACAHTNTVESFNATIKCAILGVWHWFSIKHGDRYLSELSARWNFRQRGPMARVDSIFAGLDGPALPWRELTA